MKTCCFIGDVMIKKISHCYKLLHALIDEMIAKKYRRFLLANDSEFGAMAIEVFEIFKDKYSQIERVLVQSEKFYDPSVDIKKAVQYAKEHGIKVLNLHFK